MEKKRVARICKFLIFLVVEVLIILSTILYYNSNKTFDTLIVMLIIAAIILMGAAIHEVVFRKDNSFLEALGLIFSLILFITFFVGFGRLVEVIVNIFIG